MPRVVLRHLTGSRAQQIQDFQLDQAKDLLVGRDRSSAIQYDPDKDDLVSTQHARIMQDPRDPTSFSIVDLNSRNGTFVNRQRVAGTTVLRHGDVIQFGPGGPELRFELDPPPTGAASGDRPKETREASAAGAVPPTRQSGTPHTVPAPARPGGVGPETLERRIGEVKSEARRSMWIGWAAAAVILLAVAAYAYREYTKPVPDQPWTVEKTAAEYSGSTVMIEFAWKLVLNTGEQLYQAQVQGPRKGEVLPVFLEEDDQLTPALTVSSSDAGISNLPIACYGSGSGFTVTTDGFILTNRHVAANWDSTYNCFPEDGRVLVVNTKSGKRTIIEDIRLLTIDWVPGDDGRKFSGKAFEGQNTYLDVLFRLNKLRFPASLARISDRHDVALIKINTPQPVKKIDLLTDDRNVSVGQNIIVMGYPGVSPKSRVAVESSDPFTRGRVTIVPDTTVTPGAIGRIIPQQIKAGEGTKAYASGFGDTYQLTVNATGAGNSGGPVLDDHGRVVGIFSARIRDRQGTAVTFAVPIRYGIELMGTTPAVSTNK